MIRNASGRGPVSPISRRGSRSLVRPGSALAHGAEVGRPLRHDDARGSCPRPQVRQRCAGAAVDAVLVLVLPPVADQVDVLGVAERRAAGVDRRARARRGSRRAGATRRRGRACRTAGRAAAGRRAGSRRRRCCRCRRSTCWSSSNGFSCRRRERSDRAAASPVETVGDRIDPEAGQLGNLDRHVGRVEHHHLAERAWIDEPQLAAVVRAQQRRACGAAARLGDGRASTWPLMRRWIISVVAACRAAAAGTCRAGSPSTSVVPVRPSISACRDVRRTVRSRPTSTCVDAAPDDDARPSPRRTVSTSGSSGIGQASAWSSASSAAHACGRGHLLGRLLRPARALAEHVAVDGTTREEPLGVVGPARAQDVHGRAHPEPRAPAPAAPSCSRAGRAIRPPRRGAVRSAARSARAPRRRRRRRTPRRAPLRAHRDRIDGFSRPPAASSPLPEQQARADPELARRPRRAPSR